MNLSVVHHRRSSCLLGLLVVSIVVLLVRPIHAQSAAILRLRPDGPLAPIHVLEFSSDGSQLFAAGDDKFVQVYTLADNQFDRKHSQSLRHPIGPGPLGSIQAMSVSADQKYTVVGGVGTFEQQAGFSLDGILIPSFGWSEKTLDEVGSVALFDRDNAQSRTIKTHAGYVLAAKLVSTKDLKSTFLITIGNDEDPRQCGKPESSPENPPDRSLRIFELPAGNELHQWPLEKKSIPPKLTAWATEDASDTIGLRIAVTAADGAAGGGVDLFRPGADRPTRFVDYLALAADRIGDTNQICVASERGVSIVDSDTGKLVRKISLANQMPGKSVIFSLRTFRSKPDLVAVTIRDLAQPNSVHRLNVVDLKSNRLLLATGIPLGNRQNPVIAADPTGRFVAATSDVTLGLKIFEVDKIAKGDATVAQELKPDFQTVRRASLVVNGDDSSLRFSITRDGRDETYDLIDDKLQRVELPVHTSYDTPITFVRTPGKNEFVSKVILNGALLGSISVESSTMPIGKMIRSDRLGGRPLAAVAFIPYVGQTQARLSLYDPKTGEELRRLNGHEQMVVGIEFSKDDRHLTSISADGMVCVWNLTDMANLIGRRGAILNTRWCLQDDQIVIASVEPDANGRLRVGGLKDGDRVIGVRNEKKELVKTSSPEKFFLNLSLLRPGSGAVVRVVRTGQELDVAVPLGQAADERKPLLSFICASRPERKTLDWLAWTPNGPFQSSGPEIESSAGWHFNPTKAGEPVKFAPFAEYRDEFSGETLVKNLLAVGRLPSIWPPAKTADINVRFLDRKDQRVYMREGGYRSSDKLKRMQVLVSGLPNQTITGVVGSIDSDRSIPLKQSLADPSIWESDDPEFARLIDRHDVAVTIRSERLHDGFQRENFDVIAGDGPLPAMGELPNLRLLSHVGSSTLRKSKLIGSKHLRFEAMVDADRVADNQKFAVMRGDQQLELQNLDIVGNHISADVPLVVGENRLKFRILDGGGSESTATCSIKVVDPILIDSIVGQVVNFNVANVGVRVQSDRDIDRNHFRVFVDDLARDDFKFGEPKKLAAADGSNLFQLVLSGLALPVGEHEIEVVTLEADNEVWDRRSLKIVAAPQPEQPKVELSIVDGTIVDASDVEVAIQIESRDLKTIEIRVGEDVIPVAIPAPGGDGFRVTSATLPLSRGVNQVVVTATSEAGLMTSLRRQVNRIDRPVGISADRMVLNDSDAFELISGPNGSFRTAKALTSAVATIEGRVRLASDDVPILAGENVIRASVNGFLQSVIALERVSGSDELTFRIPVTLSSANNDIHLDLPGLVESEKSTANLSVDCQKPSLDQTLHLLVISTRVSWRERTTYEKNVLELLGIANEKMPAFSRVISGSPTYPALTGEVSRSDNVRPLIEQCRWDLHDKQGINNTVLIYFQGEEMRNAAGQFCLMTSDARPEHAFEDPALITSMYLADQFRGLKCANLLFLDVTPYVGSVNVPFAGDPTQPGLGVLRYLQDGARRQTVTPDLLSHISKMLPRVGELGQLAKELESEFNTASGLAVTDSIPTPIRWMRFGELASP